jgi:hypothetical protein
LKGSPGAVVKLLPCDHVFKSWKQPLTEMHGKIVYLRPKVIRPYVSGSYMHRAALYVM